MVEAFAFLADRRAKQEMAKTIIAGVVSSRAKPAEVKKKVKELTKD